MQNPFNLEVGEGAKKGQLVCMVSGTGRSILHGQHKSRVDDLLEAMKDMGSSKNVGFPCLLRIARTLERENKALSDELKRHTKSV